MKIFNVVFWLLCILYCTSCQWQHSSRSLVDSLLHANEPLFKEVLKSPEKYQLQILYTQINRDSLNQPSFKTYEYGVDRKRYFYPASTIKLPVALLALEKLNRLNIKGLDKYTPLRIDSVRSPQSKAIKDTTAKNKLPSIAHYIKKLFIVSDNDAFNRLYEFVGQKNINESLWKKGYGDIMITHRLAAPQFSMEDNKYTNALQFYDAKNPKNIIYEQKQLYNTQKYRAKINQMQVGKGYIDDKTKQLIEMPKDFTDRNYVSVQVLQEILRNVIFPEAIKNNKQTFLLSPDDYQFLYQCMSEYPKESLYPNYEKYEDSYSKFLMFAQQKEDIPRHIRLFNKIGLAYGFMIENCYFVDLKEKVEFFLTIVIYTNNDGILNDDKYDYNNIGFPFMKNIGKVFYEYEKQRFRKFKPDLSKFSLKYD